MNDFNIRITRREGDTEQTIDIGCLSPAKPTVVVEGLRTASCLQKMGFVGIDTTPEANELVPAEPFEMQEALAEISGELGCANTLDDMLHAIAELRAVSGEVRYQSRDLGEDFSEWRDCSRADYEARSKSAQWDTRTLAAPPVAAGKAMDECQHEWYDYVQAINRPAGGIYVTPGETARNIAGFEYLGQTCAKCGKVEAPTAAPAQTAMRALEWSDTLCNGERVNYAKAEQACAALGEGWRLPTRMELESILDLARHEPAIDTNRFPDTQSGAYWTSTPCAWSSDFAWVVHFYDGYAYYCHRDSYDAFVRAVRSVPAGQ
jgi:hypothetical protein